jgi:hypothetical protein
MEKDLQQACEEHEDDKVFYNYGCMQLQYVENMTHIHCVG